MKPIYRCPKCGSLDLFVNAMVLVRVVQDLAHLTTVVGPEQVACVEGENTHDWDHNHNMECATCRHCDAASSFLVQE